MFLAGSYPTMALPSGVQKSIDLFADRHHDWRYSTIYYPRANGLAEAFHKTLVQLIKKLLANNKREWHEKLAEALWAYRTTYRTATQSTPYALAFVGVRSFTVAPLEIELPSLRVALSYKFTKDESAQLRLEELENLDDQQNSELDRARMAKRMTS